MPKEQFERGAEYKQEATRESKDRFCYLVDVLSERGYLDKESDIRTESLGVEGGQELSVRYRPASRAGQSTNPWIAVFNIIQMLNKKDEKRTEYVLAREGELSKHVEVVDVDKEWDATKEMFGLTEDGRDRELGSGEKESERAKNVLEYAEQALAAKEKAEEMDKEAGISFVSEAELKEINGWLERLIEKRKDNSKK